MQPRTERINSLQAFRALAAILVVVNHATIYGEHSFGPAFDNVDSSGFSHLVRALFFGNPQASVRVDVFFVVSGFMIFYAYQKYLGDARELRTYLLRRLIRIYPLLWLFTLLKIGLLVIDPSYGGAHDRAPVTMIASLFALPQDHLPLVTTAWTLPFEMIFYLMFGLAIAVGVRRGALVAGAWAIAIVVVNFGLGLAHMSFEKPLELGLFPLLLTYVVYERNLEFLFGCVAAYLIHRRAIERAGPPFALSLLGLAVAGVFMVRGIPFPSFALIIGLPAALLVVATVLYELKHHPRVPRPLILIGDASYSIFLSHTTFINIFLIALTVSGQRPTNPWPLVIAMTALAVIGGVAVYWLVERPVLEYLRRRVIEPRRGAQEAEPALARGEQVSVTA